MRTPQLLKCILLNYKNNFLLEAAICIPPAQSIVMVSIKQKSFKKNPMQNSHFLQSLDFHLEVRKHNEQQKGLCSDNNWRLISETLILFWGKDVIQHFCFYIVFGWTLLKMLLWLPVQFLTSFTVKPSSWISPVFEDWCLTWRNRNNNMQLACFFISFLSIIRAIR